MVGRGRPYIEDAGFALLVEGGMDNARKARLLLYLARFFAGEEAEVAERRVADFGPEGRIALLITRQVRVQAARAEKCGLRPFSSLTREWTVSVIPSEVEGSERWF
jgi:hypothetical protein